MTASSIWMGRVDLMPTSTGGGWDSGTRTLQPTSSTRGIEHLCTTTSHMIEHTIMTCIGLPSGWNKSMSQLISLQHCLIQIPVSLMDSCKSGAELWAFAALVALEQSIERPNWACDQYFNTRQHQSGSK